MNKETNKNIMPKGKIYTYFNDRLPLFVMVGLIVAVHWTWSKLQKVPYLVPESQRKDEFPLFGALKVFKKEIFGDSVDKTDTTATK